MSLFSDSYKLETGPPPTSVAEYADWCNRRFAELLANDPEEAQVQDFLEQHPWLVPGHSTPGTPSGHLPLHCGLISQPKLQGQGWYVPDFMWIAVHSGAWFPTLIEIEKPGQENFQPRRDYISGLQQGSEPTEPVALLVQRGFKRAAIQAGVRNTRKIPQASDTTAT